MWCEPIDGSHVAVIAFCEFVHYGAYHAASVFLIVDGKPHSWAARRGYEESGAQHFREQIQKQYGGHLPFVCWARDRQ